MSIAEKHYVPWMSGPLKIREFPEAFVEFEMDEMNLEQCLKIPFVI